MTLAPLLHHLGRPLLFPACLLLVLAGCREGRAGSIFDYEVRMTTDSRTRHDTFLFSVAEPVCIRIDFHALPAGEHSLATDWITPAGTTEQHDDYVVVTGENAVLHYFSCLRILRNGPFKQLLVGTDRDRKYLGTWNVYVYIDGERIENCIFNLF